MSKESELLENLRSDIEGLKFRDENQLDACRRRTEMLARRIFGDDSKYLEDLSHIRFYPRTYFSGMTDEDYRPSWTSGTGKLLNLVNTMIGELTLFGPTAEQSKEAVAQRDEQLMEQSVFIVHGHDEEMKQSVARALEKLGLKALILHEQPNGGRTVIEKFMDYGQVASFAVVLLSPDDVAYQAQENPNQARFRARQNVVLELGFFLGKLGRTRVVAIHKEADKFEMPSDFAGVLFLPFDGRGAWQYELARELKAAGYKVDVNVLM